MTQQTSPAKIRTILVVDDEVAVLRPWEKIEENPAHPRYIVTVWGVGYRLGGTR